MASGEAGAHALAGLWIYERKKHIYQNEIVGNIDINFTHPADNYDSAASVAIYGDSTFIESREQK